MIFFNLHRDNYTQLEKFVYVWMQNSKFGCSYAIDFPWRIHKFLMRNGNFSLSEQPSDCWSWKRSFRTLA